MTTRLPSGLLVSALLRRVNDAGGMGMVRARGDVDAGGVLILIPDGAVSRAIERGIGEQGRPALITTGSGTSDSIEQYWRKRRARDPDLWVIELDIAEAERFAAETILTD